MCLIYVFLDIGVFLFVMVLITTRRPCPETAFPPRKMLTSMLNVYQSCFKVELQQSNAKKTPFFFFAFAYISLISPSHVIFCSPCLPLCRSCSGLWLECSGGGSAVCPLLSLQPCERHHARRRPPRGQHCRIHFCST